MNKFIIMHPKKGEFNFNCNLWIYEYEEVAIIKADDIDQAYLLGQNDFNSTYAALNHRSTSVGDIIIDVDQNKHYLVAPVGFTKIPKTVAYYMPFDQDYLDNDAQPKLISK